MPFENGAGLDKRTRSLQLRMRFIALFGSPEVFTGARNKVVDHRVLKLSETTSHAWQEGNKENGRLESRDIGNHVSAAASF